MALTVVTVLVDDPLPGGRRCRGTNTGVCPLKMLRVGIHAPIRAIRALCSLHSTATICVVSTLAVVASFVALFAAPVRGADKEPAPSLGAAFREGTFSLKVRYRYEFVDQDGIDKRGHASTLRTSIQYGTKSFYGFSGGFEVEDVTAVGNERLYDNLGAPGFGNGITDRPVVADPEITEFNQAYLAYDGPRETRVQGGRLEYVLDNQRFVGNVGWRQNYQSFDAAALTSNALKNWHLAYVYLDRQHTVTGAARAMSSHLVHVGYDSRIGKAAAYGYFLDYEDSSLYGFSAATYGLRLDGKTPVSRFDLFYLAEYARQNEMADNPNSFGLDYVHGLVGGKMDAWALRLGYEMLRGNGTSAFQTPLGTNHKFNGFADKFLVTPANGLRDYYVRVSWDWKTWSAFVDYHLFDADEGDASYGNEFDVQAVYGTPWKQQFALKAAVYGADEFATDTTKLMLWTSWGF